MTKKEAIEIAITTMQEESANIESLIDDYTQLQKDSDGEYNFNPTKLENQIIKLRQAIKILEASNGN